MKDEKILLNELEENKQKLKELVEQLEKSTLEIDKIFPKKYDFKNRFILVDRIQVLTTLYDSILKYRSEISKQIKEQITLQRGSGENPDDLRDAVINMPLDKLKELLKNND